MYVIFIVGTAGSGKSLLTASFSDWLRMKKQNVIALNLDPGVLHLPYAPAVDVRDYVSINDLMEKYTLGPNGALVMATDLIATEIDSIRAELEATNADYVLVDSPGQLELFAFRQSGLYIANEISYDQKAILYLFDSAFSSHPLNYVSNMFLATAIQNRFFLPQVSLLSKTDLLPPKIVRRILRWGTRYNTLENAIEEELSGTKRLMSRGVIQLISRLGLSFSLIPVSSSREQGFIELHSILMNIFAGGEEII
ncbi:MAG: ATP/GTP-binding protein [Candidatus Bathyarchaeota archaeon]|jgi:GTPase SAR1 family protein|nr:ATP/GTP-binding protein [Candidatus Bathyarchaeota archaeon]